MNRPFATLVHTVKGRQFEQVSNMKSKHHIDGMLIKLRFHKYLRNLCVFLSTCVATHLLPQVSCDGCYKEILWLQNYWYGFIVIVNKAQRDVFFLLKLGLCVRSDEQTNEQRIALFPRK